MYVINMPYSSSLHKKSRDKHTVISTHQAKMLRGTSKKVASFPKNNCPAFSPYGIDSTSKAVETLDCCLTHSGGVAQVVEQRTHKPLAGGSSPSTATILFPQHFFQLSFLLGILGG